MANPEFIDKSTKVICPKCSGKGYDPDNPGSKCLTCEGVGRVVEQSYIMIVETAEGKIGFDVDNPGK
jgi:DnaJ-class molecular chaperone